MMVLEVVCEREGKNNLPWSVCIEKNYGLRVEKTLVTVSHYTNLPTGK